MKSLITGETTSFLFQANILGKYPVDYFRCDQTGFIQTELPYWLDEAYSTAITASDIGLVQRNITVSKLSIKMIDKLKTPKERFLDFGGGYGLFTRLMRDAGYPFLHYDKLCSNIFAVGFEGAIEDSNEDGLDPIVQYDVITAWEVFEHLTNPFDVTQNLINLADHVFFSTILVPDQPISNASEWWYFMPETGQHVSFYTVASLRYIATKLGLHFYTDGSSYHLFSRVPLPEDPFQLSLSERIVRSFRRRFVSNRTKHGSRQSLIEHDYRSVMARFEREAKEKEDDYGTT
ncbi:MAG: class I SAM-dependent methyltransferase [Planctomycetota bacterium]|nr:class I SAM-dependent methyltransferase [Planctomycetota bacterium]